MTALLDLRNGVALGLYNDPRLQALKTKVTVHGGDLTSKDLKLIAANTPAVVVGISDVQTHLITGGEILVDVVFRVVICARSMGHVDEHSVALNLLDRTMRALRGKTWGGTLTLGAPKQWKANSRHVDILTESGMAMWELAFIQPKVQLKEEDDLGLYVDLKSIGITWDLQNPEPDGYAEAQDLLENMDKPLL